MKYSQEIKETVVELYRSGTPVNHLASKYGANKNTIYKWIKVHSKIEDTNNLLTSDISEILEENLRLKQEVAILKKAVVICGQK